MPIKFNTIKRFLTRDEKKQIVNAHKKMNMPLPDGYDYPSFMKADIEDEFIIMKCINCGDEHEIGYDVVEAYLDHYKDQKYPEGICKKCNGKTIPLDIFDK